MLATKKNCQRVLAASLRVVSAMTGNPPLERCQDWFLKKVPHFPKFARNFFVLKICNMHSIQSEVDYRELLFLSRLIQKEHGNLVPESLKCQIKSYFVDTPCSIGFIKEVVRLLNNTTYHIILLIGITQGLFALQKNGNKLSQSASRVKKMHTGQILLFCKNLYPNMYQHLRK